MPHKPVNQENDPAAAKRAFDRAEQENREREERLKAQAAQARQTAQSGEKTFGAAIASQEQDIFEQLRGKIAEFQNGPLFSAFQNINNNEINTADVKASGSAKVSADATLPKPEPQPETWGEALRRLNARVFTGYTDAKGKYQPGLLELLDNYNNARGLKPERNNTFTELCKRSEELNRYLDDCLLFREADSKENQKEFREFFGQIKDLQLKINGLRYGQLTVPAKGQKFIDERPLSRVELYTEKHGKRTMTNPLLEKVDLPGIGKTMPKYSTPEKYKNVPLFDHIPTEDDIKQGQLGDCYLMASLISVVSQDPAKIMEAMYEDPDSHLITVRFYDGNKNPVFVTIDKSLPLVPSEDGDIVPYANGQYWVKWFEKAYAMSGLADPTVVESYSAIEGSSTEDFLPLLLGEKADAIESDSVHKKLGTASPGPEYDAGDLAIFDELKDKIDRGFITCADTAKRFPGGQTRLNGLSANHCYSILYVRTDEETGKKFVCVQNPNRNTGRGYDHDGNAVPVKNPEVPGRSEIELKDFINSFDGVSMVSCRMGAEEKAAAAETEERQKLYRGSVDTICDMILKTDGYFVRHYKYNSPEFNELRAAAISARRAFDARIPNRNQMDRSITSLVTAAQNYITRRDTIVGRAESKDLKQRSANRYAAAEIVLQLNRFMQENASLPSYDRVHADMRTLTERALQLPEHASQARRCMVQKMRGSLPPQRDSINLIENMPEPDVREDVETLHEISEKNLTKAVHNQSKPDFIRSSSEVLYFGTIEKQLPDMSDEKAKELIQPDTAQKNINYIEKHIPTLYKNADPESKKSWAEGRDALNVMRKAEKNLKGEPYEGNRRKMSVEKVY